MTFTFTFSRKKALTVLSEWTEKIQIKFKKKEKKEQNGAKFI